MKTLTKKVTTVVLAAVMLVACIITAQYASPNIAKANADDNSLTDIYYFTDYYPTLPYAELVDEFSDYNIEFDHQYVNEYEFSAMCYANYFFKEDVGGLGYGNYLMIIDIKTFKLGSSMARSLFRELKITYGCTTVFVSAYDYAPNESAFMEFVDAFVCDSQMVRLEAFVDNAFQDMIDFKRFDPYSNFAFVIDGDLMQIDWYWNNLPQLLESSPFLRKLFKQLSDNGSENYMQIADDLRDANIYIFVQRVNDGETEFVDILRGQSVTSYEEITENVDNSCAFGFLNLSTLFYDFLMEVRNAHNDFNDDSFPIYGFIVDPIVYGPDGLVAETSQDLNEMYGDCYDPMKYALLGILNELLAQ